MCDSRGDRHRTLSVHGIAYNLERTKIDQRTKTFEISGGFEGKPALMKTMKYADGLTFRWELKEVGSVLQP